MLISPPFLPTRTDAQQDEDWVHSAMPGGQPGDGAYPVSHNVGWHGGMHITAPRDGTEALPVRAIADGTVVYVRQPTAPSTDPTHALNYGGGWTSDGVVVVRHETIIGDGANAQVTFFSVYMHLSGIDPSIVANQPVYRKYPIGDAGQIYGSEDRKIHFEILLDDTSVQHLVGRASGDVPVAADGRTDAVYGEVYVRVPSGTSIYAARPDGNVTTPAAGTAVAHTTTEDLFVGLSYGQGNLSVTTYRASGAVVDAALVEANAEYDLYVRTGELAEAYAAGSRPVRSAVYELLRFGRTIHASETLAPADMPHWREIAFPGGRGFANLNATGTTKYSDADFPHWRGWSLVDDSADQDSRCDSTTIRGWLDANSDGQLEPAEVTGRLRQAAATPAAPATAAPARATLHRGSQGDAVTDLQNRLNTAGANPVLIADGDYGGGTMRAVQAFQQAHGLPVTGVADAATLDALDAATNPPPPEPAPEEPAAEGDAAQDDAPEELLLKLRRVICKFPTEWEAATINARWSWLMQASVENPGPLSEADFEDLRRHIAALCFWQEANLQVGGAALPASHWRVHPREFIKQCRRCGWLSRNELARCIPRAGGGVSWAEATQRAGNHGAAVNLFFQKYMGADRQRHTHGLAQIYIETALLGTMTEFGRGRSYVYDAFYGRGLMQLTWAGNYDRYGQYKGLANQTGTPHYTDNRITSTSTHLWEAEGARRVWSPRYDPDVVGTQSEHSGESAGFYWVSKSFRGTKNINRVCDLGLGGNHVGFVSWLVNGGSNGYQERQQYARYVRNVLLDEAPLTGTETWRYPSRTNALTGTFPPGNPPANQSVQVNHARQSP